MFLPHLCVKSIVGSLRDGKVACSASDRQGSNFESCVWRTVSSYSSHHPQEVLLAQCSLYVQKGGLKHDSFHFFAPNSCYGALSSCCGGVISCCCAPNSCGVLLPVAVVLPTAAAMLPAAAAVLLTSAVVLSYILFRYSEQRLRCSQQLLRCS